MYLCVHVCFIEGVRKKKLAVSPEIICCYLSETVRYCPRGHSPPWEERENSVGSVGGGFNFQGSLNKKIVVPSTCAFLCSSHGVKCTVFATNQIVPALIMNDHRMTTTEGLELWRMKHTQANTVLSGAVRG